MTYILDLVDNRAEDGLLSEHGLSLLIEHGSERLLLDTGAGSALRPNAEKLGVDLRELTRIVLSHSHYDHTGGLAQLCPACPVHVGADITAPSYSKQPEKPMHPLGMPEASVDALSAAETVVTKGLTRIADGLWLSGPIPRHDPLEHLRGFFSDAACTKPTRVPEEQALLTDDGVLVTGCCHAGIINTVECFKAQTGLPRIRTIVGGLHLCWSSADDIRRVTDYLNGLGLDRLVLLHCTGDEASSYLAVHMNCSVELGSAGRSWELSGSDARGIIEVVGAIIRQGDRYLVGQRAAHKSQGGKWEFVGGKIEPGETPERALVRECREELALEIENVHVVDAVVHEYPDKTIRLTLLSCTPRADSDPTPLEHQQIRWVTREEMETLDFSAADRELIEQGKLDDKKCTEQLRKTLELQS